MAASCAGGEVEQTHRLAGRGRDYRVVTRRGHDPVRPAPVLVALHAYFTSDEVLEKGWGLVELAVRERGFILVVPKGLTDSQGAPYWNATRACCDRDRRGPDDIGYLHDVLEDVKKRFAVDTSRVYALGVSNGGFMSHRWACEPGGDLAGIVSISGAGPGVDDAPCAPSRPVRVLEVHGERDETVRYEGGTMHGAAHPSARASVATWLEPNGCELHRAPARESQARLFDFKLETETWSCPRARVALWTASGGGHDLKLGRRFVPRMLDFLEAR